ncbi:uncharacterized protein isoform X2 [Rhodnius prolixus]
MPPFRASQLIYSEFPEDKGRSLHNDLERKDVTYTTYAHTPRGDLDIGASQTLHFGSPSREHLSSEASQEAIENYKHQGIADHKGDKNDLDDFSLESFELDPEVMKPPPPLSEESNEEEPADEDKEEIRKEDILDVSNSTESETTDSTDAPVVTTQLEIPSTPAAFTRTTVHTSVYPIMRRPIQSYRSSGLQLISNGKPIHIDKWRTVLSQRELTSLQMMKPPPLARSQTWRKKLKLRSRPTIIYL